MSFSQEREGEKGEEKKRESERQKDSICFIIVDKK